MDRTKLKRCVEGAVITAIGALCVILSLNIRNNPVTVNGTINLFVQAKFLPVLLSLMIFAQGINLMITQWKGKENTTKDNGFSVHALIVTALTLAYFLLVYKVGFAVPTVVYIGALLFVANKDLKPLKLLVLTGVYSAITLLLIPTALNLQLF